MAEQKSAEQASQPTQENGAQATPAPATQGGKKKGGKKKVIIIVVVVLLALIIGGAAAGGNKNDGGGTNSGSTEITAAGQNKKYAISIDDAKTSTEYGNNYITVTFTFTNNSDEETMISTAVTPSAYQDGVELSTGITTDSDNAKTLNKVQPGVTTTFTQTYKLSNTTSDVQVKVTEWAYKGATLAERVFTIA